jgi:hypothetical protein
MNRLYFWLFPPRVKSPYDRKWKKEREWFQSVTAIDGVDYTEAQKYAEKKYDEMCKVYEAIDKKGEWVFGIAFAASGAALAALHQWKLPFWPIFASAPSLICLTVAMVLALRARMPAERPSTMKIRDFVHVCESAPSWIASAIAGMHCTVEGFQRVNKWKSDQINRASFALILGAVLFFPMPLVASLFLTLTAILRRS